MREHSAVQGIRCLQQLGLRRGAPLDAAALARAEGIDTAEVATILGALETAGFVEPAPGAPGSFQLTRAPSQIRVAEVWAALLERAPSGRGGPTLQQMIDWEEQAFRSGLVAEAA